MKMRLAAVLAPLALVACGLAAPASTPTPTTTPTPAVEGFYLRAWQEQALPPEHTFGWLPQLTIADGAAIDGNVVIPLIFPGPLFVLPNVRGVTEAGQARIIDEARQLGLLDGTSDFTGGRLPPGAPSAHIEMSIGNTTHRLVGDPQAAAAPEPGSPAAFALFWQRLTALAEWMPAELGPVGVYAPERVAVAAIAPGQPADIEPNERSWPLEASFGDFGEPWVVPGSRCATVDGEALEVLMPELQAASQADVFIDDTGEERSLIVRPLVPGEPAPCPRYEQ